MALLNEADAIFLGIAAVDKVFLGEDLVWPPVVVEALSISINRNYVYNTAPAATLVGVLSTEGGLAPYTYTLEFPAGGLSAPLDGLSPTGAWSAGRTLLTAYGGAYTHLTGGLVDTWYDQSGNSRNFVDTGGTTRPTPSTAGPNGRAVLDFNGTDDQMDTTGFALSNFIAAGSGYAIASFLVDDTTSNLTNIYDNDPVFCDTDGYIGLFIKAGNVQAFNWDATSDVSAINAISTATAYVVEWRHESGNLYMRVNGGVETAAVASGNTQALAGVLRVGRCRSVGTNYADLQLCELATFSTVPSQSARNTLANNFMSYFGIMPFYLEVDDLRVNSVAGLSLGAYPIIIDSTDDEAATVEKTIDIYILETGAPALHSQRADRTSPSASNLFVSTTGSTGTLYWVVTQSSDQPTPAQIIAGQNESSGAARDAGTIAVSSVGQKTDAATGLNSSNNWAHFYHVAADAKVSNIVTAKVEVFVAEDYLPIGAMLARRTVDLTTQDYSTGTPVINWNTSPDIYDMYSVHDGAGANPTKIIITPEYNGKIVVIRGKAVLTSTQTTSAGYIRILKNGASEYDGCCGQSRAVTGGSEGVNTVSWMQCQTQPIVVVTGDEFQLTVRSTDNSVTLECEKSSLGMLAYSSIKGALCKKAADQTAANYTTTAVITWNTDIYDTDGGHDITINSDRITIPAAWNGKYGILRCNVRVTSALPDIGCNLTITKGGVSTYDGVGMVTVTNGNIDVLLEAETQPILLTTGDYFSASLFIGTDTSVTVEQESSTFGIQVFDVLYGCLVKKASDQASANYTTPTIVTWGTDVYDTHDLHSSASNTKIIIPASLNGRYATVRAQISVTLSGAPSGSLKITKNGQSEYDGVGQESHPQVTATGYRIQCSTQLIQLTAGDEFEVTFWCNVTPVTVVAASSTFGLQVEEVEAPFVAETFMLDGLSPSGAWSASRRIYAPYLGSYYNLTSDLVDTWFGQVSSRNYTQGTAGNRPLITASGPNIRAAIDCAGTDEFLATVDNMSTFMSTTEGYYIVSFMPDDVSYNQANVHDSGPVVSDPSALHGIYIKKNSIQAMCNDGSFDFTSADFINAGGVHTAEWWHVDGVAYFRLDGGPIRLGPSGTMSSLAAAFRLAANRTINQFYNNVKIFEKVVFPTVPSLAARNALVANMLGHIGGTVTTVGSDPHFDNVVFLAGFDVGDNLINSYIEEAKGAVGSWNGSGATDTDIVLVGEGSAVFNGGSLRFPTLADYRLSAANSDQFTIELKATTTTTAPANKALVWKIQNPAAEITWALATGASSNELRFIGSTTGTSFDMTPVQTTGLTWATGTTYDIAVDKDATGKIRIYRNGVMVASGTPSNSAFHPGGAILSIGNGNQDINPWAGSLDEIRITKNVARYASDSGYTPTVGKFPRSGPVPATDPYFANVLLLMPFDGTIISGTYAADYSSYARVATFAGNAQIHTVFSKFGSAALLCDGTGDGVNIPDSDDWNFAGQFTVECFFRCSADNAAARTLMSHRANSAGQSGWVMHYIAAASGNDTLTFAWSADGTNDITTLAYAATNAIPSLQWHHAAVDRDASNVMRLYFNGVMVASATQSGASFNNTQTLSVGAFAGQVFSNHGYISEVRISNIARYASNSGFTVPTTPYPRA